MIIQGSQYVIFVIIQLITKVYHYFWYYYYYSLGCYGGQIGLVAYQMILFRLPLFSKQCLDNLKQLDAKLKYHVKAAILAFSKFDMKHILSLSNRQKLSSTLKNWFPKSNSFKCISIDWTYSQTDFLNAMAHRSTIVYI